MYLSIVSPVYRAEKIVDKLVEEIHVSVRTITDDYEIILVEDGSPDHSWAKIETICQSDPKVKGIKLSRNFGQHPAISAGLQVSTGEWVVVMDCDLQDRPAEIPRLYTKAMEGFDTVLAQREYRHDSFLKKLSSRIFYKIFSYLTDTKQDNTVANFGIYHQKVIKSILNLGDRIRFFPTMVQWVGFRKTYLPVQHDERFDGKSSYSWKSLLNLAFNTIVSFSDKPLRLTIRLGLWISLLSSLLGVMYVYQYFTGKIQVLGFASLIITLFFLFGLIIFILGIIGIYIGKTFEQVKKRPNHIVDIVLNPEK